MYEPRMREEDEDYYGNEEREKKKNREMKRKGRLQRQKERPKEKPATGWKHGGDRRGGRGLRRAKDDDIDRSRPCCCLRSRLRDPPGYPALVGGWDKMAAGRTSRPGGGGAEGPRSGLCVVINGNLKQRELTISFFISSPMLSAPEVRRTPTRTAQTHVHTDARARSPGDAAVRTYEGRSPSGKVVNARASGKKRGSRDPAGIGTIEG